jgi:hypothetical protein
MQTLLVRFTSLFLSLSLASFAYAEDTAEKKTLPLEEKAFVKEIPKFSKAEIIERLGEPTKKEDYTSEETGEVFASIWEYNSINTDENGQYYANTELDFVGDNVNVVVFMNDNSEKKIENIQPMENSVIDLPTIK